MKVINNRRNNKVFNEDANKLVRMIQSDIVYIDTPYNNRQYAANYHLMENIARNDKPDLAGKTKIFDWSSLRSDYAMKKNALKAMEDLLQNINATHVILSYNDDGIISIDELIELMRKNSIDGKVDIEYINYRKYKSKMPSQKNNLNEMLIYIQRKPINRDTVFISVSKTTDTWSVNKNKYIKSPLNYIGGKYKLLKQIMPLFPDGINTFVDLFSGGANVGINVEAKRHIFNDMNSRVNEMFRYFATKSSEELIGDIKARISEYGLRKVNEKAYIKFRSDYNASPNPLDLYVLASYSYNY